MSQVVVGMPRQTFTSAERVADPGGSACSSSPGPGGAAGALAGLVALAAIGRRRPALAALALIAASGVARAQEPIERKRGLAQFNRDITPVWASFQLRHDFQHFGFQRASSTTQANAWDTLQTAYAPWVSVLRIEAGPQIFRVAEINFGLGFMTHKGYTLDSANNPSSEAARLQWLPLSIGGTLRAHILDEQPLVPFAGAGVDWVFYREDQLDTDGLADKTQRLVGSKNGWHWFVGGAILLDSFAPSRAARMEALTGINDSWLTIEYRAQEVGPNGGGFDFSGWALGIGLKLDY